MRFTLLHTILFMTFCMTAQNLSAQPKQSNATIHHSQLIRHVKIIDGTGSPAYEASVRIIDNKISEIGSLSAKKGEQVIEGNGLLLCPGFIDTHSHHYSNLAKDPSALATANQGITTIVIGQDGESYSMDTLDNFFNRRHVAVNVATYTGQTTLRELVMGENDLLREAKPEEIEKMKILLNNELEKGSLGLSTGLEYEEAFYSSREEVMSLANVAAKHHARYMSHIRSEDITLGEAIDEIIEIGRKTHMPVQISHLKISMKDKWKQSDKILEKLDKARNEGIDITADVYPYAHWNATLKVLFPKRDYTDLTSARFAVDQLFDANESVLVNYAPIPSYKGKTLSMIAEERKEEPAVTLMNLIKIASDFKKNNPTFRHTIEAITAKSMDDQDINRFMKWPHTNICSDGIGGGHPRGYGTYPRFLGKYIRKEQLMNLETAIHKMTQLAAEHVGIKNRGVIAVGNYADLVLFNPDTVIDNATFENSKALSTGIETVWLNGQVIYKDKKSTGTFSGVLLKR